MFSARDFPDTYGNKNEIVSATTVIVFFSIIVMGACCEPLLHSLKIRMGVDNEEYMKEWRNRRSLNGRFHKFGKSSLLKKELTCASIVQGNMLTIVSLPIPFTEKEFIYDMVVRDSTSGEDGGELLNKGSFSLYENDAWLHRSYSASSERATTANATAILLTGEAAFDTYSYSYGHSPQR